MKEAINLSHICHIQISPDTGSNYLNLSMIHEPANLLIYAVHFKVDEEKSAIERLFEAMVSQKDGWFILPNGYESR